MLADNIKLMSKEIVPIFSDDDVAKIKKFCQAQTKDIFDHLSKSLAPNVHGHEYIKKAILCMLLRGNERALNNGTRIKGDINIVLLVGEGKGTDGAWTVSSQGEGVQEFTSK